MVGGYAVLRAAPGGGGEGVPGQRHVPGADALRRRAGARLRAEMYPVDTHRQNKPMQNLLRESGYRYRGNILVDAEPGHDPHRQAFEKLLKDRK